MESFDKISIAEISKKDMLLIIEALDYTGKNKNSTSYIDLKDNIVKELSILSGSNEDEFLDYLRK